MDGNIRTPDSPVGISNIDTNPAINRPENPRTQEWSPRSKPDNTATIDSIRKQFGIREDEAQIIATPTEKVSAARSPDLAADNIQARTIPQQITAEVANSQIQTKTAEQPTSGNFRDKLKANVDKISWGTKLAATSLLQLGGLHPWRSGGKWVWVLEPWARRSDDPRQRFFDSGSDKYFASFKAHKGRLLNLEAQGYQNPSVTPDGFGGIQLLDHRRIHEARNAGKAIVVNVANLHGAPKTYN